MRSVSNRTGTSNSNPAEISTSFIGASVKVMMPVDVLISKCTPSNIWTSCTAATTVPATGFLIVRGPEGATFDYMKDYMDEVEARTMPLVESGEVQRLLVRAPSFFGGERYNAGIVIFVLKPWNQRRSAWEIMDDVRARVEGLPGVRAFPIMRQGFGGGRGQPVQFVIGGGTYEELVSWRDTLIDAIAERMPELRGVDSDYKETQPQLRISIDHNRAGSLGVSVREIGLTLQTMLGSRRVTTYLDDGEEYDVIGKYVTSPEAQELARMANASPPHNSLPGRQIRPRRQRRADPLWVRHGHHGAGPRSLRWPAPRRQNRSLRWWCVRPRASAVATAPW